MENNKIKMIFMGTPRFGAIVLEKLCQSEFRPIFVITEPDKPVGRKQILTPPPVKVMALKLKIEVFQPVSLNKSTGVDLLRRRRPDLIVVAAYGQILPKEILDIPKYGCLNVHPSLLPKYRGPSPIQAAILNGDKETGVTIMLMDEGIDTGPILAQKKTEIGLNETFPQLHDRLAILGSELLIDTIPDWLHGRIKAELQDNDKAMYAKTLKREDGLIDWKRTPEELDRRIRALNPWPGAYTFFEKDVIHIKGLKKKIKEKKKYRLKILKAKLENDKLIIEEVQQEGKKPMSFEDFLRGNPNFKPAPLETRLAGHRKIIRLKLD